MTGRIPAQAFPPGDFVRDELEARGWTRGTLAEVTGWPLQFVDALVSGRETLTPETACGLADAFGTSPEFWTNLETAYRPPAAWPEA